MLVLASEAPTATPAESVGSCAAGDSETDAPMPTSTDDDDTAADAVPAIDDSPGVAPDGRTRNRRESSTGQAVDGTRSMILTNVVDVFSHP